MGWLIVLGLAVVAQIVYGACLSSKTNKLREETIARRKRYVESMSPTARIIVNNGTHLFFKDDEQQIFGLAENHKVYSFTGLYSMDVFKNGISFTHKDELDLDIGIDIDHPRSTIPLDYAAKSAIIAEMLPIVRDNLYKKLKDEGISPTHEYEHDGQFWGCDINSKKFYTSFGVNEVFDFSLLHHVTIEDATKKSVADYNYVIHVYIMDPVDNWCEYPMYDIYFDSRDSTFYSILSMFKGILNRK